MKKRLLMIVMAAVISCGGTVSVSAAGVCGYSCAGSRFVDENGNGINDNCTGNSRNRGKRGQGCTGSRAGRGNRSCRGNGRRK